VGERAVETDAPFGSANEVAHKPIAEPPKIERLRLEALLPPARPPDRYRSDAKRGVHARVSGR
jgi:hypothetical protein